MGIKVKAGDVFLIPLDENFSAGGILISKWKFELYVAVFEKKFMHDERDALKIINSKPIILTLTLDAKLWHGHWPIIGNELAQTFKFPQPAYKIEYNGKFYIESRDMKFRRLATNYEAELLDFRTVSSPAGVENATKGKFGIVEWNPQYECLLSDYAIRSSKLLP
jgi:Immunity protein 26